MRKRNNFSRALISMSVAAAVTAVFTMRSFAAPDAVSLAEKLIPFQDCTGTLTVASGQVTINGNEAKTGATVLSGSMISTDSKGDAVIDLGSVGRVELGESTTITLICMPGSVLIKSECGRTEIEVRRGTVDVKSPKIETLQVGHKDEEEYRGSFEATAPAAVDVKIECERRRGAYLWSGWAGLLALLGIGAGIAAGVSLGGEDITPSSPIR